jgi:hypothetical protein
LSHSPSIKKGKKANLEKKQSDTFSLSRISERCLHFFTIHTLTPTHPRD